MDPFIAEITIVACNFAPRGWAFCNGQLLPIAQNTALFSLIGTTYGGDGRTTTALPNLQGRMPMGEGRGPGLTSRVLGEKGGTESVALALSQIPSHTHRLQGTTAGTTQGPNGGLLNSGNFYGPATAITGNLYPSSVENAGGGQAHSNGQPIIAMNYCIALTGLYPSRS